VLNAFLVVLLVCQLTLLHVSLAQLEHMLHQALYVSFVLLDVLLVLQVLCALNVQKVMSSQEILVFKAVPSPVQPVMLISHVSPVMVGTPLAVALVFPALLVLLITVVQIVHLAILLIPIFAFNAQLPIVKDATLQLLLNVNFAAAQLILIPQLLLALHAQLLV
jgi:hypothetical protein